MYYLNYFMIGICKTRHYSDVCGRPTISMEKFNAIYHAIIYISTF